MKQKLTIHYILKLLIIPCCMVPVSGFSKIRNLETTWSKSTAGAGVGSILMDEATSINPAPLGFFQMGSFYVQKSDSNFEDIENQSANLEGDTTAVIISDAKGALKGSLAYYKYQEKFDSRKQYAASIASTVLDKSSVGVTYKLIKDKTSTDGNIYTEEKYYQTVVGVTHAINNHFTLGLVAIDPLQKREEDTRGIIGLQYVYQDFISIMLDGGTDYYKPLNEKFLWRGAMQFKVFADFFIRAGLYNDKGIMEKGSGVGIGWVGPRLVANIALKNSELLETEETQGEKIRETSFSLSYKF